MQECVNCQTVDSHCAVTNGVTKDLTPLSVDTSTIIEVNSGVNQMW